MRRGQRKYEEYRKNHKDELDGKSRRYYQNNKLSLYLNRVYKTYGLVEEDLQNLLDKQRGCCDICYTSLINPDSISTYNIDHCHATGKVRGLLCSRCNIVLGKVGDDDDILLSMIDYLRSNF